ncbi:MAG TPA: ATP-grasp fold amidoligase family protein [Kiritimatiellia bacterium]|jgi:hypothetical protein|nr:glycosyl transferase [Lentisphaerota bacterium]HRV31225.1 ATP-grasp fold amidoligase family protein [Kiritimatiellia bacterium]
MREFLKKVYAESDWGCRLLFPLVQARDWLREGWRSDRRVIERQFQAAFGRPMDWRDPRTLNEKMNWMKLHFRDPLQRVVADKYAVREHVQAKIGAEYLIPLIRTYERAEDIRLAELPSAFALKVNHGSGQNWLVQDKAREDEGRIRREFYKWMRISHYAASREWPYRGIRPLIVAEELLLDENHAIPSDIKFHCFHGRAATIQVDLDRATNHRRNFYDLDWQLQPFVWTEWEGERPAWPNGRPVARPEKLAEMIRVAEVLAADFPYARIDLFECRGKVYFGEITFYHGGGFERFDPPEWDRHFGDLLRLP